MEFTAMPEDVKMTYWQHLSIEARHRLSDLDFYDGEILFLRNLISKYLHWLMEEDYFPHIQTTLQSLQQVEKDAAKSRADFQSVITRLGLLIENPFAQDESRVRESYVQTNDNYREMVEAYRVIKKEIFQMVEQSIRTEKAKKMIGSGIQPLA